MTTLPMPDGIVEPEEEQARGFDWVPWLRLGILAALPVAAVAGVLGGTTARHAAESPSATLNLEAPKVLRNGIFVEYRLKALARRDVADLVLAVPSAHWHEMTINTVIPTPTEERSRGGEIRYHYGPLRAGEQMAIKVNAQVNPPKAGTSRGQFRLLDGEQVLVTLPFHQRVLP